MVTGDIYQLLKHITGQIGITQLYFVVPAHDDDMVAFEIMWEKDNNLPWSFSVYHADNWTRCSKLDIIDALEEIGCDLVEFHVQIVDKALSQAAYMDMRMKNTYKLLGHELVDASIAAYEDFGKNLLAAVDGVLNDKRKGKLTLVKD